MIIDYGMGNLKSVAKALTRIGAPYIISNKPSDLQQATHAILPGVGAFDQGIENLHALGLYTAIKAHAVEHNKPLLGICLGMQLLFSESEEGTPTPGLGLIQGQVRKFTPKEGTYKVPHIGWNEIERGKQDIRILEGIADGTNFYFIHSYYATTQEQLARAITTYDHPFISAVQKGNIFGTQFHPEKSQKKGLQILRNFASIQPC